MNLESLINSLTIDDPSVNEVKRIIQKEGELLEKGLRAWLLQYHKESSTKLFLAPIAAYIALQLANNSIQQAAELLCPGVNLPHSAAGIPLFIKSMPHRFMKIGFTGSPLKEKNPVYAQLAWLFVDWSKPYQEQFWKILYPELVSVYDGHENVIWPVYGQGILVRNFNGDYQNKLINYAQIYKLAQTEKGLEILQQEFSAETLRRVYRFYPGHKEFWINVQNKKIPQAAYINYLDFFTALQKFLLANRYTGLPDPVTKEIPTDAEITATAQATFWSDYAPFLKAFVNHINTETDAYKRKLDAATQEEDARLLRIVNTLLYPPQKGNASCFNTNQAYLLKLLRNPDRSALLKEILISPEVYFDKFLNENGTDHLPAISQPLKSAQDKKGLLELINDAMGGQDLLPEVSDWVNHYKNISKEKAYHIVTLHDFLYEIQNKEKALEFLKIILGTPLDLSLLSASSAAQFKNYAEKIIGYYPQLYQTQCVNSQSINEGLKKGFAKKQFSLPIGFLRYCGEPPANIFAAMSSERFTEISALFNNYIDAGEPLTWDSGVFLHCARMQDLETLPYFIDYYSSNLIDDFFKSEVFFIFFRAFYIAGETRPTAGSPAQNALFESIVLPSLSLYCKNIIRFLILLQQMGPYANKIISEMDSKIHSLVHEVSELITLVNLSPRHVHDQLYDKVKERFSMLIPHSGALEIVQGLFPLKPVRSDFVLSLTKTNTSIDFSFLFYLYEKSSKEERPAIMALLKESSLPTTFPRHFILGRKSLTPAGIAFSYLSLNLEKEDFRALITYYQESLSTLLTTHAPCNVVDFVLSISDRVWPIFHQLFQKEIQLFATRFLTAGIDFDMADNSYTLSNHLPKLDSIFGGFVLKMLGLIQQKRDLDALCKMFPIVRGSNFGFAPYLYPLMRTTLNIYKLFPASNKTISNEYLAGNSEAFFKELFSNPLLEKSWKIALMPSPKQRRNAVCQILLEEDSPGSSPTSSIVRFSPPKIKAIVAATTHPLGDDGNELRLSFK